MLSRESSNYVPNNADEVAALVQVPGFGIGGTGQQIGGVSATTTAQVQASIAQVEANKAAAAAAAAGGGTGTGASTGAQGYSPFDPRGLTIPDNFWGFAMLVMGMR